MAYGPGLYPYDRQYTICCSCCCRSKAFICAICLLLRLGHILHVDVEYILDFTYADLQSSESGVDAIQPTMV